MHEVDPNAVRPGKHRRLLALAELIDERMRLLAKCHASFLHCGGFGVKILRLPTQMVNGTSLTRREYATLQARREQPEVPVQQPLPLTAEWPQFAAKRILIPRERRLRVRRSQMNMMEPGIPGILQYLDPRTPWILDEAGCERTGVFPKGLMIFTPADSRAFNFAAASGNENAMWSTPVPTLPPLPRPS